MVKPVVMQIVGFQNSGKTYLMNKFIMLLTDKGFQVATVKHHGHGGKPEIVEGKDSSQYIKSGAMASLIEGDGRVLVQVEKWKWSLEKQVQYLNFFQPDFILIEGHKSASFPKIVLVKNQEDYELLKDLNNIKAFVFWEEGFVTRVKDNPSFSYLNINDEQAILQIVEALISQRQTE